MSDEGLRLNKQDEPFVPLYLCWMEYSYRFVHRKIKYYNTLEMSGYRV